MTITVNPELRGAALAQATAEYITEHPEEWDQDTWGKQAPCGTTACIAGTAVLIAGLGKWTAGGHLQARRSFSVGETAAELFGAGDYYGGAFEEGTYGLFHGQWFRDETADVDDDGEFPLLPLEVRLREMWRRVAALFPEGEITIPDQYR